MVLWYIWYQHMPATCSTALPSDSQGAVTITVRYGAQRQQFGPAEGREVAVLDYTSQQLKLMPMLATCYALHFTAAFLVEQYTQAKRTKEEELVADVHSLSAGPLMPFSAWSLTLVAAISSVLAWLLAREAGLVCG